MVILEAIRKYDYVCKMKWLQFLKEWSAAIVSIIAIVGFIFSIGVFYGEYKSDKKADKIQHQKDITIDSLRVYIEHHCPY